ncbi:MAG: transcription-repair coupling factor [Bacteroidetes bacterium]|nr:transcription-repair coupling factor [Bacteroidota bacterium]
MKLSELLEDVKRGEQFQSLAIALASKQASDASLHLSGFAGAGSTILSAAFIQQYRQPVLFIVDNLDQANYLANDLSNLLEGKAVDVFPSSFKRTFQYHQSDNTLILQRAEVLSKLNTTSESPLFQSTLRLIVSYPEALVEQVITQDDLTKSSYEVKVGDRLDIEFFLEFLVEHGFERSDFVYEAGYFSIRGGILDVYSFSNPLPFRIELDGEIIESIREFSPEDQLSTRKMQFFSLVPNVQSVALQQSQQSLFDYLPDFTTIWSKDLPYAIEIINKVHEKCKGINISLTNAQGDHFELPSIDLFASVDSFKENLTKYKKVEYGTRKLFKKSKEIFFNQSPQPSFHKQFNLIKDDFNLNKSNGYKNLVFSDSGKQIERLYAIFDDIDPSVEFEPVFHSISEGFVDHDLKLVCYTEHQLFDRFYKFKARESHSKTKMITLKELRELKPGDFVVHVDHGIGKFAGLEKMDVSGTKVEVVRLVYRDNDLLYVPINALNKISKYIGKEGTEPRLNKLGSDAWDKLKRNTKAKVKDIARDLIKLYAARKAQTGYQYSPDNYMQTELEASFIYEDTPDQAKATEDFKRDMESPNPMDRLVCGDVGFGKTEVAIRAAFKAVCDSKQVAVLVPTTILASQHYRTFKERLRDFPVNIDFVNRFRTATEQKDILRRTKEGKVDILIGTHRILSKDVGFKDLGLMIIDEEQKFGVASKEKLKQFRVNVDTLTLTATPIPRTLHFSLMGARDLSIINTPPPNRQPVTTELHAFDDDIIRDAINEEVERGGQVFVIHNRVKDIYEIADKIRALCPKVRVGVGHGQLEGHELEEVMIKFVEADYDVLVATTIIESGLDITNANTILINNAHMYGLSDIHQMRGRVGRSNKKAYCYLLVPGLGMLTEDAKKRLSAIEEFSDLGSGFNIAMRDLDIRGSGNLLGAEQSGFIAEIGYEMYHKILDEAVQELKDDEFKDLFKNEPAKETRVDVSIDTDLQLVIPDHFVRSNQERLSLYAELSTIETESNLEKYKYKLKDRFGALPPQVLDLTDAMKLKWAAQLLHLEKVVLRKNELSCFFPSDQQHSFYSSSSFSKILANIANSPQRFSLKQTDKYLKLIINDVRGIQNATDMLDSLLKG